MRTVSEDQRERDDEHDLLNDVAGWFSRNLDDAWVMVSPGIYRLREDMPEREARLPTPEPAERD